MKTPIIDEDVGISADRPIVNPQTRSKKDFVNSGTATENMLDFLTTCLRYGVSICVAGATSSGKTTVLDGTPTSRGCIPLKVALAKNLNGI